MDPKGVIQGPFSSKEVLKWADAGFFTPDQQVEHSQHSHRPLIISASAHWRISHHLKQIHLQSVFLGLLLHAGAARWRGEICVIAGLYA